MLVSFTLFFFVLWRNNPTKLVHFFKWVANKNQHRAFCGKFVSSCWYGWWFSIKTLSDGKNTSGVIKWDPFWGDQTIHIYGKFEGFPLYQSMVGNLMTPALSESWKLFGAWVEIVPGTMLSNRYQWELLQQECPCPQIGRWNCWSCHLLI